MARRGGTPENLIPARKGEPSRNPHGRPKKLPEIDKLLADVLGEEKDGITAADAILRKLRAMAAAGNIRAAEILLDRAYGKAKQQMDLTSGGNPVPIPQIIMPKDE
jgi:hypothetical protein